MSAQEFRWVKRDLYERKLKSYEKTLEKARRERQAA
jgi:hypothetical protein